MNGYKAIILADVHIDHNGCDKSYLPVRNFIAEFKPDKIFLLGDYADCSSLSHWNLSKRMTMEGKRHKREIAELIKDIEFLSSHTNEIIWLEGNHENWLNQYLEDHPEIQGLVEYHNLIDFKKYNITWVSYNKLYKTGKVYLTHGRYVTKYHAAKHAEKIGANIIYGHTHVSQVFSTNKELQSPYKAWGLGCLCGKTPDYLRGKPGAWDTNFGILYVASNGDFNFYTIDIINNRFYWAGKRYD